jgi:anti-anti-sigma factor
LDECEHIGDQLAAIFEQAEQRQLLVDLRNVLHLSSLVLSRLISLKRDVHAQGGQLVLCNLAPPLADVFRATQLDQAFEIRADCVLDEQQKAGRPRRPPREPSATELFAGHGMISQSPAMEAVFRKALSASELDRLPVLIVGESGTGKELLAKAIHALHPTRHDKPFYPINCACINPALAESHLFGHRKGAFTGADQSRLGAFAAAHGGTLLLDEIGDMDVELQPKLLRVLQQRRMLPVGEDYELEVDVRIIAATNRPLEQMIAQARFRLDLYERLNVLRIDIPPLRERPEDIELQAIYLLERYQAGRRKLRGFSPEALDGLRRLTWGGNTRQLENMVLSVIAERPSGPLVELEDLPAWARAFAQAPQADAAALPQSATAAASPAASDPLQLLAEQSLQHQLTLAEAVEQFERRLLHVALQRHAGRTSPVAAELKLTRQGLLKKLKKYNLVRQQPKRSGAGRRCREEEQPGLIAALEALVEPVERGDPMSPLRWTCKSTYVLADELATQGFQVSSTKVGALLKSRATACSRTVRPWKAASGPERPVRAHRPPREGPATPR